jgi:hypothetical protein
VIGSRLFNALLRRLPRQFADRFAGELRVDVAALRRDARRRGGWIGEAIYVARELVTLWRLGRAERLRSTERQPQPRFLSSLLVDLTPRDPLTIAVVVTVMALTAIVAAAVPALRAARVDPIDALRTE